MAEQDDAKFLVRRTAELLRAWDELVLEDTQQKLRAFGYAPEALAEQGAQLAQALIQQQRQKQREQIRAQRLAAEALAGKAVEQSPFTVPADVDRAIKEILSGRYGADCQRYVQTYFRNLQDASLDDKVSLLRDIQLLKELSRRKQGIPKDKNGQAG